MHRTYTKEERDRASLALSAAAQWLTDHEWCQGTEGILPSGAQIDLLRLAYWRGPEPRACSMSGALAHVVQITGKPLQATFDALELVIGNVYLFLWNDVPGRTRDEVVAAMRRAAELFLVCV